MKYSFLLPAYKRTYLEQAICSILSQTYVDFELIVSNDASPENLDEIVGMFNDKRIVYRKNETNIGAERMVEHWNKLLSLAKGEYVIMAADDDVYDPYFLEKVDMLALKYPSVDLIRARVRNINIHNDPIWEDRIYPEFQDELAAVCSYPTVCMGNYVFKRVTLNRVGGFLDLPYAMGSDTGSAMIMARNGMVNTYEILFNYRISDMQVSHVSKSRAVDKSKMYAALTFHRWMDDFLNSMNYDHILLNEIKIRNFVNNHIKRGVLHCARNYCGSLGLSEFYDLYKKMDSMKCFGRKMDKMLFVSDYFRLRKMYR